MSLRCMGTLRQSNGNRWRSMRTDPPPVNPVIPAAMGSSTVTVDSVAYLTRLVGYDTEECIQKAVEEGVIELDHKSKWERDHDVYRFTAKGAGYRTSTQGACSRGRRSGQERTTRKISGWLGTGPPPPPPRWGDGRRRRMRSSWFQLCRQFGGCEGRRPCPNHTLGAPLHAALTRRRALAWGGGALPAVRLGTAASVAKAAVGAAAAALN